MLLRPAPRCCCLFACRSGPRRELSSKVTVNPNGPRARPPAPPTNCTTSRSRATRRSCACTTSTAVAAPRDQTLCAAWQTPSVVAGDGAEGAARPPRPPSPHAGCSLCAWTDQACVAGAPRHRRSSRRQPCRSACGLTSRGRSPWSSGRTQRSTATAVGTCACGSSAVGACTRVASQSPR